MEAIFWMNGLKIVSLAKSIITVLCCRGPL